MRQALSAVPLPPAIPESPDPQALYALACALWREGKREAAIAGLDDALRRQPNFPEALSMGGYMLAECGKPEAALRFYRRALQLESSLVVAQVNAGKLLFDMGRFAEALEAFEAATRLSPTDADAWNSRAGALRELGRLEDSRDAAGRALALRPDLAEAAINLGNAFLKLDRMDEALEAYRRARAIEPGSGAALCGEALALRNLGRFAEALSAFEAAEALGSYEAIGGKGCLLLTLGDFERGWEGYEARWVHGKSVVEAFGTRLPQWAGPSGRRERVLVFNDHGIGDTLQFARYLPLMATAGVEATFVCPSRLWRLFSPTIAARFVEAPPKERFEAQIALSSLPRAFRTRLETIPAAAPYLAAEPELREKWAARIGPAGFKIGVVWQGNSHPEIDRARSAPLAALAPLAAIPRVRLISLQKGFGEDQIDTLPAAMRVERLGADFDSGADAFVDTAAAMMHLDLVVSCDTSIVHLAGALARPVWVALKSDAEWRWMTERSDSPWYPTLQLFRQSRRGDWSGVFGAMAHELARRLNPSAAPEVLRAPCPIGDLIDRTTILRIKAERIADDEKRANVRRELALLERLAADEGLVGAAIERLGAELAEVNARLWSIEDAIRACDREGDFGPRFVALARSVYVENDERARLKRAINALFGSPLVEEKSYVARA
jgi:Flp pilus assembly protein TadD